MFDKEDETILQDMIENGADEDEVVTYKALVEEVDVLPTAKAGGFLNTQV